MANTESLIRFIKSHGNEASIALDGTILAQVEYVKDGRVSTEWERITPTLEAVRNWLGY